jgi:phage terminase large subunit-like protein
MWRIWLVLAGRGFGKLLCLGTMIPTPTGWKRLQDIAVGDEVFDESGRPCRVLKTFDAVPDTAYRLWFSDGTFIDACGEHQWVTWTHAERKAFLRSPYEDTSRFPVEWPAWRLRRKLGVELPRDVVERALGAVRDGLSVRRAAKICGVARSSLTKHLTADRYVAREPVVHLDAPGPRIRTTQEIVDTITYGPREDTNHCVPVCGALQTPDAKLPVDPYVLGAWLGDGSKGSGDFTAHESDQAHLRAAIEAAGYRTTVRKSAQTVGTRGLLVDLRRAGVLEDKHVPAIYLRASPEQRLALLRGLMDTDGSAAAKGTHVEFSNTNKRLVDAVVELARSLGQKPVISECVARIGTVTYGKFWRVCWTPTVQVFAMPRKVARMQPKREQALRHHHRMIVRAERIAAKPMRCLTVDAPHSMFLAGEAMIPTHNTRCGVEWVREQVETKKAGRLALVGATASDVRDVLIEGESGILATAAPWCRPTWQSARSRLVWPNGAMAFTYSAEEPDRLRGKQHDGALCDELASWRYPETWDQLMFGLRLGVDPRVVITTTPRPTDLIRAMMKRSGDPADVRVTRGSTFENPHLAAAFRDQIARRYLGTRLGRQEIDAEILDDNPGALWKRAAIDELRVLRKDMPSLIRVVVAVDPAVSSNATSNETGIVVAGLGSDGHGYVLDDRTLSASPHQWASEAVNAYRAHNADRLVGEVNNGGDLVETAIRTVDRDVSYRAVRASRGKHTRAEPIAALYEQGRVHHVGALPKLEDQMCQWDPTAPVRRAKASDDGESTSPDRIDALVWALTELMLEGNDDDSSMLIGGGGRR